MKRFAILSLALLITPACVSKSTHEAALADAAAKREHESSSLRARIGTLGADIDRLKSELDKRDAELKVTRASNGDLQAKLDEQTVISAKMRKELEKLGKDVDALLVEGGLGGSIAEAKKRLAELRKAQAAAEARATMYAQLLQKFRKMIDAGSLEVTLRDGRMVLRLSNDVLFDSGKAQLKATGKTALEGIAFALKDVPRKFQVSGHTDDEPIKLSGYESNWELSTARALTVVSYLLKQGIKPQQLSAAGYGEFDPVASNDSPLGRAKNRRTEISIHPNIDELVQLP
jgi:chemotaxis protein MotB